MGNGFLSLSDKSAFLTCLGAKTCYKKENGRWCLSLLSPFVYVCKIVECGIFVSLSAQNSGIIQVRTFGDGVVLP